MASYSAVNIGLCNGLVQDLHFKFCANISGVNELVMKFVSSPQMHLWGPP